MPLGRPCHYAAAMRSFGSPPTAEEIEAIARGVMARLPEPFAQSLGEIVLQVEDFADERTLEEMGIEDAFELSGLYEGVPLTERSVEESGTLPERVLLFRRPILDEWAENGEVTLRDASDLWGKGTRETVKILQARHGGQHVRPHEQVGLAVEPELPA